MTRRRLSIIIVISLISGCSSTKILSVLSVSNRYLAEKDIPYGEHPQQTMDIYLPLEQGNQRAASCKIVFVYGGSWDDGDKSEYGFAAAGLAKLGYFVAVPNYRKYPEVVFPAFVNDLALALRHPRLENSEASHSLVLIGHSAGALNAALVSYDKQYLNNESERGPTIDGLVTIAGPHDYFLPSEKPQWQNIFGSNKSTQIEALSVNHITPSAPPTLILHGESDKIVTPRSASSLAKKLDEAGVKHRLRTYPNIGHRRIVAALAPPLQFLAPTLDDIDSFIKNDVCSDSQRP